MGTREMDRDKWKRLEFALLPLLALFGRLQWIEQLLDDERSLFGEVVVAVAKSSFKISTRTAWAAVVRLPPWPVGVKRTSYLERRPAVFALPIRANWRRLPTP